MLSLITRGFLGIGKIIKQVFPQLPIDLIVDYDKRIMSVEKENNIINIKKPKRKIFVKIEDLSIGVEKDSLRIIMEHKTIRGGGRFK